MTDSEPVPDELYTVKEVATKLRVHRMTVYRLIRSGRLPGLRISERGLRVTAAAYAAYLASTEVKA